MKNPISKPLQKSHSDCSACSLCLLVCPVWRRTRDVELTPHGRAKALQHGASSADIAASVDSCTLCMACEPVCPERIGLSAQLLDQRRELAGARPELQACLPQPASMATLPASTSSVLLPDRALRERADLLSRIANLLGKGEALAVSSDDGADIALALEAGIDIPAQRQAAFLAPLRGRKEIIVADGLLLRHLRGCLPGVRVHSLGEALSRISGVRAGLRAGDLYVIEPRAYHSDYERLVKHYDDLRAEQGCAMNLDLQRIAIPATARSLPQQLGLAAADDDAEQGRWLLLGREIRRIVVESLEEGVALGKITGLPVVHLAEAC